MLLFRQPKIKYDSFPTIQCPTCKNGVLLKENSKIIEDYPSWIKILPPVPQFHIDEHNNETSSVSFMDIEGTDQEESLVSFFLHCSNQKCKESVLTCGVKQIEMEYDFIDEREHDCYGVLYFFPKLFYPTISIVDIPFDIPDKIREALQNSFSLYWVDACSCVNAIRKTVERIMDHQYGESSDSLHKRIKNISDDSAILKSFLEAAKWIGNEGSHGDNVTYDDVSDAYEFIAHCLSQIFNTSERDLKAIADSINESRRPYSNNNPTPTDHQ